MKHFHLALQGFLTVVLVALVALAFPALIGKTQELAGSKNEEASLPTVSVLFLGNSYTYVNDLPGMVGQIASSDPNCRVKLAVQSVTRGSARLKDLWDDGKALKVLRSEPWDFVVLQEQSLWALSGEQIKITFDAAADWNREILKASGHTVLYGTWARQAGSSWYSDKEYQAWNLKDADTMQRALDTRTRELAERLGASAIYVGDAWDKAQKLPSPPVLFASDGSHPSPAGTYLAALLFYRHFTGSKLDSVRFIPSGVTPEQARELVALAAE
jgi:hypothetical protein